MNTNAEDIPDHVKEKILMFLARTSVPRAIAEDWAKKEGD